MTTNKTVAKTNTNVAKKATPKPAVKKPTIAELTNEIKVWETTVLNLENELIKKNTEILNLKADIKTLEERSLFGEFMFRISKNFR